MKKGFLLLLAFAGISFLHAQPTIQWQKCLGGTVDDFAESIQPTFDGGYIVAGFTLSNDLDVSGNHGNDDFWVAKLDSAGAIAWQKCLGGSGYDEAYYVQQAADSSYFVTGFSTSTDGDVTGNHGTDDFWVVKLSSAGNILWQKSLGGSSMDDALSILPTTDGGCLVTGDTQSNDGDVTGNHGGYDCLLFKLDSAGNIEWQKCLGGTDDDTAPSIQQTADGGYILAGSTTSNDGDVSGNHGNWDYWIVKLTSIGTIEWQKCLGGTSQDIGYSIRPTTDSCYIVAGFTLSNNGDVSGKHGAAAVPDCWAVKLDATGTLIWQICLGGSGDDKAYAVQQTNDDGYVVAGYARSVDGDVTGNHGSKDYWVAKLTAAGTLDWQKSLGGSGIDWARSIEQLADGSYVVAGWVTSNDDDVSGNHGANDFWIVKLNAYVTGTESVADNSTAWQVFPNPSTGIFSITGNVSIHNTHLKILNSLGQLVCESPVSDETMQVDLSACAAGIYFVIITGEDREWMGKVRIE